MPEKPSPRDPAIINDLVAKWQRDQDERARDELVRRFMPVIKSAARRWGRQYLVPPDDADQESAMGFLRAIDTFDPAIGSLEKYAYVWSRSRISRARHAELPVKVPFAAIDHGSRVTRAGAALQKRLGRRASVEEIATEAQMSVETTEAALAGRAMPKLVASMDTPIADTQGLTIGDTLVADAAERPDIVMEEASTVAGARAAIEAVMAGFVERHREVIRLRFLQGLTLEGLGERMGVTRERVRQIETKAVPRLREALFDHPAVLEILGREPGEVEDDDGSGRLLSTAEVEALTGLDREEIFERIGRGGFPRAVAADNRRHRLWRESAVEKWRAQHESRPPVAAS